MSSEEIEVTILKDGSVQILVRGVQGPACLDLTRALEAALGGQIITREMTPEAGVQPDSTLQQPAPRRVRAKRTS